MNFFVLLFFFTNKDVDEMSWHGAASVDWDESSLEKKKKHLEKALLEKVDHSGKWTLQIFKELPFGVAQETFIKEKRDRLLGMLKERNKYRQGQS
jgi:hypothetical protein